MSQTTITNNLASFIWSLADLLRGDFKQSQYGRIILPFKPLNAVMRWAYETYGASWSDEAGCERYGMLSAHEDGIRRYIKDNFSELKEKHIKDLLDPKIWARQKQYLLKARA